MQLEEFNENQFAEDLEATLSNMELLSRENALHFIEKGYVVVRQAFPRAMAEEIRESTWRWFKDEYDIDRNDPSTWNKRFPGKRIDAYLTYSGGDQVYHLSTQAPRAFQAQVDAVGGTHRFLEGEALAWNGASIANLGVRDDPDWKPAGIKRSGWHKDGWHFRHFLDSPEQGLLTVPIFSDIAPKAGGMHVAVDSVGPVARLMAAHPEGLHPDSIQGSGYLVPVLLEQCSKFEELTGEAGDMVIVHPYMLHRACSNPAAVPRFVSNKSPILREPMCFNRKHDHYSMVELSILKALGVNRLDFQHTREATPIVPPPHRDKSEVTEALKALDGEMQVLADTGVKTPSWAEEFNYSSNAHLDS